MASRIAVEKVTLKSLQAHHHLLLNSFTDQETLIDAISIRPGFVGANPVAFLSLHARRRSLELGDMEEALLNDRTLIRAPAFKGSLFLIATQDYALYFRTFGQAMFNRGLSKLTQDGISKNHLYHFADLLRSSKPPLPMSLFDVSNIIFLPRQKKPTPEVCQRIVQKLCDMGVLIRSTSKGWKGNDFSYPLFESWVPEVSLKPDNPDLARTETVRRYLLAYGPAAMEDISWWTGLSILQCQRAIANLRRDVTRFNVETYREDMIGLRETIDSLRKKVEIFDGIQILPPWDPWTLGWKCKKRVADRDLLPFIFDQNGNPASVIVDSGKVIGLWQLRDNEVNMLEYHLFNRYNDKKHRVKLALEDFSMLLSKISGTQKITVIEREMPKPISEENGNSFLWPLGKILLGGQTLMTKPSPMERRSSNTFRQSYLDNQYLVRQASIQRGEAISKTKDFQGNNED